MGQKRGKACCKLVKMQHAHSVSFHYGNLPAAFVFVACGDSAANVPFSLVGIQNLFDLNIQAMVAPLQPFGQILVYGGFADTELAGGSADGSVVLDDVHGQIAGPFFHVVQSQHSLHIVLRQCMHR